MINIDKSSNIGIFRKSPVGFTTVPIYPFWEDMDQ